MYYSPLVFNGDTDQIFTAVLRPGTCHVSRGALAVLKRQVRHIRCRWPDAPIEIQADSGFAVPALYGYLEVQRTGYTIALGRNPGLEAMAAARAKEATQQRSETTAVRRGALLYRLLSG